MHNNFFMKKRHFKGNISKKLYYSKVFLLWTTRATSVGSGISIRRAEDQLSDIFWLLYIPHHRRQVKLCKSSRERVQYSQSYRRWVGVACDIYLKSFCKQYDLVLNKLFNCPLSKGNIMSTWNPQCHVLLCNIN